MWGPGVGVGGSVNHPGNTPATCVIMLQKEASILSEWIIVGVPTATWRSLQQLFRPSRICHMISMWTCSHLWREHGANSERASSGALWRSVRSGLWTWELQIIQMKSVSDSLDRNVQVWPGTGHLVWSGRRSKLFVYRLDSCTTPEELQHQSDRCDLQVPHLVSSILNWEPFSSFRTRLNSDDTFLL